MQPGGASRAQSWDLMEGDQRPRRFFFIIIKSRSDDALWSGQESVYGPGRPGREMAGCPVGRPALGDERGRRLEPRRRPRQADAVSQCGVQVDEGSAETGEE